MPTTLADVTQLVQAVQLRPSLREQLVSLLDERHGWRRSLSRADAAQVRGYVLAVFEHVGLPDAALPFALEELQSGHDAYAIAGAARALRGLSAPSLELEPLLLRALDNLSGRDEVVSFGSFEEFYEPIGEQTAGDEVRRTLAWLRQASPDACCALPALAWGRLWFGAAQRAPAAPVQTVQFEDHDGRRVGFEQLLVGRPALVAFFYTRCENPRKCSLTLSKLAGVQAGLQRAGMAARVRIAAISYDPDFDSSERLRAYASARGLLLGEDVRALRSLTGLAALHRHFRLGVGFVRGIVSRHRIELFVLDARGRVAASFTRLEWSEDEVVERCRDLLRETSADTGPAGARARPALLAVVAPALLALWPKCPLCWSAYLSALGIAGLEQLPYPTFAAPLLVGLVLVNAGVVAARARATRRYWPLVWTLAGAALLSPLAFGQRLPGLALAGVLLTFIGAVAGALQRPGVFARASYQLR